jgi:hypothetical protein
MPAAATKMSHLKRFIDILRSRFDDGQLVTGSEFVPPAPRATEHTDGSSAAAAPEPI